MVLASALYKLSKSQTGKFRTLCRISRPEFRTATIIKINIVQTGGRQGGCQGGRAKCLVMFEHLQKGQASYLIHNLFDSDFFV